MIQNLNEELFSFIKKSPTGFHAVHELANYLTEAGKPQRLPDFKNQRVLRDEC